MRAVLKMLAVLKMAIRPITGVAELHCGLSGLIACKCRNLDQAKKGATLNLLAVEFAERDGPAGAITLTFSGGAAIRLDVECLEAELADLGEVYAATTCPDHFAAATKAV